MAASIVKLISKIPQFLSKILPGLARSGSSIAKGAGRLSGVAAKGLGRVSPSISKGLGKFSQFIQGGGLSRTLQRGSDIAKKAGDIGIKGLEVAGGVAGGLELARQSGLIKPETEEKFGQATAQAGRGLSNLQQLQQQLAAGAIATR